MSRGTDAPRTLPRAPLAMPARGLHDRRRGEGSRPALHGRAARWITFGGGALLTIVGTRAVGAALPDEKGVLELVFLALFALTFGWIAVSACSALAGSLCHRSRRWPEAEPRGKVALAMPVYNEDAARAVGALLAMARGVARRGYASTFEVVILSDTNRPDAWARETAAVAWLRGELRSEGVPVWYRRRALNSGRKAGNVQEFVRRAGARYTSMVVLDADSVMAPETLVTLARRMEGDPRLALLQTVPRLHGGRGLLPRMQQFAAHAYGPVASRGVASWSGPDGNFWGHNAIIRMEAFADAAGLPELKGPRPFGGHVMSHDFAEAAWLRRAGWDVRMDPDLGGSYEEGPPTLLDHLARDRRWMQGNLQHGALLGARGLRPVSRVHLAFGIASYLASVLWLGMLVAGTALVVRGQVAEHRYFSAPHQLAPDWPRFDPGAMLLALLLTAAVLLAPKVIGLAGALRRCRSLGEVGRTVGGAAGELVLSTLLAPAGMLAHTRAALQIALGRDSGWSTQNRGGGATPWGDVLARHGGQALLGAGLTWAAARWAPAAGLWASPILAGLVLAPLLSRWSGSPAAGALARRCGLFGVPEERRTPRCLRAAAQLAGRARAAIAGVTPADVLADPERRRRHLELVDLAPRRPRGAPDMALLGARARVEEALTQAEVLRWVTPGEAMALLSDPLLVARAARLPRGRRRAAGQGVSRSASRLASKGRWTGSAPGLDQRQT